MLGVLLLATALRLHDLDTQSLWNDEGNSYVQSTRTAADIAVHAARDIHPPGYYWLLGAWRLLHGESEFALRSLSALASLLSVAFTFALGRRLFGVWPGLVAALLVTLNTFSIYYAQEARMYSLNALWAVASLWALVTWLDALGRRVRFTPPSARLYRKSTGTSPGIDAGEQHGDTGAFSLRIRGETERGVAVGFILFNAAGLWTHYSYPFVMIAQGIIVVIWLGGRLRRGDVRGFLRALGGYVAASLVTIALFLPWLPTALTQLTGWAQVTEPTPLTEALGTIMNLLSFGLTFEYSSTGALAIVNIVLLFGLLPGARSRHIWRWLVPVVWVGATVGLFLAADLFRPGNLKFLLPAQIGLALWLARGLGVIWGFDAKAQGRESANEKDSTQSRSGRRDTERFNHSPLRRRVLRASVLNLFNFFASASLRPRVVALKAVTLLSLAWLILNLAVGIGPLYTDPAYQRADYRGLTRTITDDLRPGDAILLNAPNQAEVFGYYYNGAAPVYPLPPGLGGDDAATRAALDAIIERHDRVFVVYWGEAERDPNRIVETTLDAATYEVSDEWYGDVRLARYVMPVDLPAPEPVGVTFGDHITLVSSAINTTTATAGAVLQLELNWQTDAPLDRRYKVFVQLLDPAGRLVAQRDSEPGGGLALTTTWEPGVTVTDRHGLALPQDLSPAHYTLIVGLYDIADSGARLPVTNTDYFTLTTVNVTEREESES